MIQIKKIDFDSLGYWGLVRLREIVLRLPLGMRFSKNELKKEEFELIFGLYINKKIVSCCQFIVENHIAKLRQVATAFKSQGLGYGEKLNIHTEMWLKSNEIHTIYCHARKNAVDFYLKMGYEVVSEPFEEVGLPHVKMMKKIKF